MSFKVPNISEGNELSNPEIRSILLNIYDRLTKPSTKEVGYELFLKLILKNLSSPSSISYIISQLSEFIPPLSPKEKEPCLKLLSLVFFNPIQDLQNQNNKKNSIYYQFLSPILSIIQSITKDSNNIIFPQIANTYAEIVQNIMPTDISYATEELNMEEKRAYEMLQGFCIYNMKQEEKANRIIGSLCLTKLVENCPVVLQEQYMKFIWENIMNFIDTKNYTAKYELLNCLISLILGAEGLFTQYANATLYKVLDFLTEDDWNKRKLALNVIYTLIFYCKDEVLPLKDHIINFLRVLKTDKVKEVREVCLLILQIFNENEPTKKKIEKEKSIGAIINKDKKGKNRGSGNKGEIMNNTKNRSRPKTGIRQQKKNNKFFENNKKFTSNPFKDNSYEISDNRKNNNINNNMNNITTYNNDSGQKPSISLQTMGSKNNMNTTGAVTGSNTSHNKSKGKKSNNFVNEKMVIKPDPNKSIFKAIPNPAFFKQGNKKSNDIVVMAKGKPIKANQNINVIENNENKLNKNNFNEQSENNSNYDKNKKSYESTQENREEKKKDYLYKDKENKNINMNMDDNNVPSKRSNSKDMKYAQKKEDLRYKNFFNNDNDNNNNENYNDNYNEKENDKIDEEEDDYKNKYIEKNYEIKDRNNYGEGNEDETGGVDQNIIQKLLKQMEFLDKGHMSLENMFDNIQIDTQEQIENLNANFGNLELKTNRLNKDLNDYYINGY